MLFQDHPEDMYGYWYLSDDYMFFGTYGNFSSATGPDPVKISKYSFVAKSPIPSLTGKFAPKFNGNIDTTLLVRNLTFCQSKMQKMFNLHKCEFGVICCHTQKT